MEAPLSDLATRRACRRHGRRQQTLLHAGALFAGAAIAGLTPAADGDFYWHLAAGREMFRTHAVLISDPFSSGAGGRPWVDVHWLFQLAIYAVHRVGGLGALVLAKCVLLGLGALLLLAAIDRAARPLFVPLFVGALFCVRHLLLVRPVIVTLVFLAFFFFALERFRRTGRWRALVLLPLAQVVWCNCQGLAAFGPAFVGAYAVAVGIWAAIGAHPRFPFAAEGRDPRLAARQFRQLLATLGFCLLGSLATPYGTRAVTLPFALLARMLPDAGNPYEQVAENIPPFTLEHIAPGQFWHLPWFLALLALAFAVSRRRLLLSHLGLVAGFVVLALMGNRNVLLLYWMATPIAAMQFAPALRRALLALPRKHAAPIARWAGRVLIMGVLSLATIAAAREPSFAEPAPFHVPIGSTRALGLTSPGGTIFAADHHGGYLIWKLYPRFKPYIDTRLVLRTPKEFSEYLGVAENPERFDAFQQRHRFSYVLLPVVYPDRYLGLITHLYDSPEWKLIFTDAATVLFARRDLTLDAGWSLGATATTRRILADVSRRFGHAPRLLEAARLQLATLLIAVHELAQAERVLSEMHSSAASALRARSRLAAGDIDGAQALAAPLLRDADHDPRNLDLMALVHMRRGQLQEAVTLLRSALAIDPFDSEATRLLAAVEEHQHAR